MKSRCSVSECQSFTVARGLCDKHYRRFKKYGDAEFLMKDQHGMRYSKAYRSWCHIKDRCRNPLCKSYAYYGGRGINICDEWNDSFMAFYEHIGDAPSGKHQVDRTDNNCGYVPGNVRWVLPSVNNQNRRSTKLSSTKVMAIRQSSDTNAFLALKFGVSYSQVCRIRSNKGWKDIGKEDGL